MDAAVAIPAAAAKIPAVVGVAVDVVDCCRDFAAAAAVAVAIRAVATPDVAAKILAVATPDVAAKILAVAMVDAAACWANSFRIVVAAATPDVAAKTLAVVTTTAVAKAAATMVAVAITVAAKAAAATMAAAAFPLRIRVGLLRLKLLPRQLKKRMSHPRRLSIRRPFCPTLASSRPAPFAKPALI